MRRGDVFCTSTVPPPAKTPAPLYPTSLLPEIMTGEPLPVPKEAGSAVTGGTVNWGGVLTVQAVPTPGTRICAKPYSMFHGIHC